MEAAPYNHPTPTVEHHIPLWSRLTVCQIHFEADQKSCSMESTNSSHIHVFDSAAVKVTLYLTLPGALTLTSHAWLQVGAQVSPR